MLVTIGTYGAKRTGDPILCYSFLWIGLYTKNKHVKLIQIICYTTRVYLQNHGFAVHHHQETHFRETKLTKHKLYHQIKCS